MKAAVSVGTEDKPYFASETLSKQLSFSITAWQLCGESLKWPHTPLSRGNMSPIYYGISLFKEAAPLAMQSDEWERGAGGSQDTARSYAIETSGKEIIVINYSIS